MDKLKLITAFVAVAEEKSFAAGARRLGMLRPAVTRSIAALESQLGVKLLDRTTRTVKITSIGERYLKDSRRIIEALNEADAAVIGINAEPQGHLTVTAPVLFGKMYILPCVIEYMHRYPLTSVSAIFLDRSVNLLEEGFDVGVQIGELPDSNMKAINVGKIRQVTCASPEYLRKKGIPQTPADLSGHNIISTNVLSSTIEWRFLQNSVITPVRVKPKLIVLSNDEAFDAAIDGFGIAKLTYQALPSFVSGKLKFILTEFEPIPQTVYVLHREGRYGSAKVRTFVDLLVNRLRNDSTLS